jgi:hypothetical protein
MCIRLFGVLMLVSDSVAETRAEKLVPVLKSGDGEAKLREPFGVDFDRAGNLYFVEFSGHRVRKLDAKGTLYTVAGTGEKGFDGDEGPANKAHFNSMHSLAVAANGDIYLADTWNNRVRKIEVKNGKISTIAGTGEKGFGGDGGPATKAKFGGIYCLALNAKNEKLYLADLDNRRIRAVDLRSGRVETVAGNGERGIPKDGTEARKSPLVDPRAVAVDAKGNIYILERAGHALRVVDGKGAIRTVAGTGKKGFSGDGGDALRAEFNGPKHLCVDGNGDVLIADTENHVIRKYLPRENKVIRVAGCGRMGSGGLNGPPLEAQLNRPHGVYVRSDGVLYIADSGNDRILKITK